MSADDSYEARVRESFARQTVMQTLGVAIERVAPGEVRLAMPFSSALMQQHGYLHAGVVATALDSACGYAAMTLMPAGAEVLTIEFKINLLAPARGERFAFQAKVMKAGRTITVCDGQAYALAPDGENLIATMTGTLMTMLPR